MLKILGKIFKKSPDNVTIVGEHDTIDGFVSAYNLYVDGTVKSKKTLSLGNLSISSSGYVESNVHISGTLEIYGKLVGNIGASSVLLHKGASVHGNIQYSDNLSIDSESDFTGSAKKI